MFLLNEFYSDIVVWRHPHLPVLNIVYYKHQHLNNFIWSNRYLCNRSKMSELEQGNNHEIVQMLHNYKSYSLNNFTLLNKFSCRNKKGRPFSIVSNSDIRLHIVIDVDCWIDLEPVQWVIGGQVHVLGCVGERLTRFLNLDSISIGIMSSWYLILRSVILLKATCPAVSA